MDTELKVYVRQKMRAALARGMTLTQAAQHVRDLLSLYPTVGASEYLPAHLRWAAVKEIQMELQDEQQV